LELIFSLKINLFIINLKTLSLTYHWNPTFSDAALKTLDAENRKNIAEIGRLHSENTRLTQAANRSVCQRCTMRSN
jgi:hypothetical protein